MDALESILMAIIKLGAMVVGIRGTMGGVTFSANKSGPYARVWSRSANPRTTFQQDQRSVIAAIPVLWRVLTAMQQAAWDTWAALPAQDRTNSLGETISISGFNWFTIINTRLINIGRSTRTAVPTQSRPSAPTILTMQIPFDIDAGAWVTYASGEFDPDFDQVIEIATVNSTGVLVEPRLFKLLLLDTDPPDTENTFLLPYLERFSLSGDTYKAFARMYRQTTDGLRSSAATLSFVEGDTAPFVASAMNYNGTTNWAARGADLTSNADSKVFTFATWFRIDAGDGTARQIVHGQGSSYVIQINTANQIRIRLENAASAAIADWHTDDTYLAGAAWHHITVSVDLGASPIRVQTYVDGVAVDVTFTTTAVDDTIDWTVPDHGYGATDAGAVPFDGCLSQTYLNNVTSLDLDATNVLNNFISPGGAPMWLGSDGSFPTGSPPIIFVPDGDPSANAGFGGNYVNNAALSACSTVP